MIRINEYLSTKIKDAKYLEKDPNDPSTWEVGDILSGTFGYSMILPRFYKIIKRTAKSFTVVRLEGKIVSGHRNGQWEEIATDDLYDENEPPITARINKHGTVHVKDVYVTLWDGKPIYGDDMD